MQCFVSVVSFNNTITIPQARSLIDSYMASDLPMRRIKFCSVLFDILVKACCHKRGSLMHESLRDKRTSTLQDINYFTVETIDDTPPVIDAEARYWS